MESVIKDGNNGRKSHGRFLNTIDKSRSSSSRDSTNGSCKGNSKCSHSSGSHLGGRSNQSGLDSSAEQQSKRQQRQQYQQSHSQLQSQSQSQQRQQRNSNPSETEAYRHGFQAGVQQQQAYQQQQQQQQAYQQQQQQAYQQHYHQHYNGFGGGYGSRFNRFPVAGGGLFGGSGSLFDDFFGRSTLFPTSAFPSPFAQNIGCFLDASPFGRSFIDHDRLFNSGLGDGSFGEFSTMSSQFSPSNRNGMFQGKSSFYSYSSDGRGPPQVSGGQRSFGGHVDNEGRARVDYDTGNQFPRRISVSDNGLEDDTDTLPRIELLPDDVDEQNADTIGSGNDKIMYDDEEDDQQETQRGKDNILL